MSTTLNWGILAAGSIARTFARGVQQSKTGKLVAVGSRDQSKADAFAQEFDIPHAHDSYEKLLSDPQVQAVYIATPHPMHAQWAIKAAEAGKHILCEKPIALNAADTMAILQAARDNDVFLMEAYMYRVHPQTATLVELIQRKAIGELRMIDATFSFAAGFNPDQRLFKNALGGGGILDVGGYTTSMVRLLAGAAMGKPFAEPLIVRGVGHLGQTGVDEYAAAVMEFPGEIIAQVATGVRLNQENRVILYGTEGRIVVSDPWIPAREGGTVGFTIHRNGKDPEEVKIEAGWLYALEADTVARYLDQRQASSPAMSWEDTLGNMQTLDRWRESIGLMYESEKPSKAPAPLPTVANRPLRVRDDAPMTYGALPRIDKKVSRLVMGVDNQTTMPIARVMFDDFFEQGGTVFDTAHIYGGGQCEKTLGQWIKERQVRDQVVVLGKGGHTPWCNPKDIVRQLDESLERLQTDHLDIYMLHRDNLELAASELIGVLNEQLQKGKMRALGVSNWSIQRIEEANAYAKQHHLVPFTAVSNQLSLARMVKPVWAGCISAGDPESRQWFTDQQMALMPWSSQARGFFTDRSGPDKREDESLVESWYSEDNFQRKARVQELAQKYNTSTVVIALAYVLQQPFPTFPLIGPRTIQEFRDSLHATTIKLTPEELRYLNLEA